MPELNTDLTDLSDVTDEAIEAALRLAGWMASITPKIVRSRQASHKSIILLARCIQAHYPDMIVDPVTAKAREALAALYNENGQPLAAKNTLDGDYDDIWDMRLILAGMAMERGE